MTELHRLIGEEKTNRRGGGGTRPIENEEEKKSEINCQEKEAGDVNSSNSRSALVQVNEKKQEGTPVTEPMKKIT